MATFKDFGIKHFKYTEWVPRQLAMRYSEARCIEFLDMRIVRAVDWIRQTRGNTIYMNTYDVRIPEGYPVIDGRGVRIPSGDSFQPSQHFRGRAGDIDEWGTDNGELWEWCRKHAIELLGFGVTTIEDIRHTPTWVHLDCRFTEPNPTELKIVRP